jgi:phage terminase small subunit
MRGRPKEPSAIAKVKGTYQPCRHKDDVADSGIDFVYKNIPMPPGDMGKVASKFWTETLSMCAVVYGYVSFLDLAVFRVYCEMYEEMEEIKAEMTETGQRRWRSEDYKLLKELRKEFFTIAKDFGFTPSARRGIQLVQRKDEQKQDEFKL